MSSTTPVTPTDSKRTGVSPRRWVVILVAVIVLGLAFYRALNPYNERGYVGISHGDHVHYVPQDRDPSVSISSFPTIEPGPDERILPDGRVVPIQP